MKKAAAGELLIALIDDPSFERTGNPTRDRKIVDALLSVGNELPKRTLSQAVKKIAGSLSWAMLFKAARKEAPGG